MKKTRNFRFLFALLGAVAPLWMCQAQTTFFSDNFSNGSTTNGLSVPGGTPTASFTSYDIGSTKNTAGFCTMVPNLLHMTLGAATTSGFAEAQALFATNPVSLNVAGDYIEIAVVFTNTAGTIYSAVSTGSALWLGLYNSGSTFGVQTNWPVPNAQLANGGYTTAQSSPFATGNCQLWQGFEGQILSNSAPRIITRPVQNGTSSSSANQDLLGAGVGSGAFGNPGAQVLESATAVPINLATTGAYTWDMRITLTAAQTLQISNAIFLGPNTGGTIVYSQITSNLTQNVIATAFDGLGIGFRGASSTANNPVVDISSILITGQSTLPTVPPTITQQPAPTFVTTNGSCAFSVIAQGDNTTYQWYRNNGQKLSDGSEISGSKTSQLIISPAGTADQFTGANNGYYCLVAQGPVPGLFVYTSTNPLTLINTTNLVWNDSQTPNDSWDVNNTFNWQDTNGNVTVFNYGQPVLFDETGQGGNVSLVGSYISPSSVTVNTVSSGYKFIGSGSIAGPTAFNYIGTGLLTLNCANTYTGGTIISNASASVVLDNYAALSTGPVTLAKAGGQMEVVPAGSATSGIQGNVVVADDFTMTLDQNQAFSLVFLNNLSGTAGKTLTLSPSSANPDTNQIRVRVYGGTTTYNGNLAMTDKNLLFASYQASGTQTFNGVISGLGGFMEKGITTVLNGANTYSGGTTPAQGAIGIGVSSVGTWPTLTSGPLGTGPILLTVDSGTSTSGNGFIFATVPNLTLGNAIQYVSGTNNLTLDIGGSQNITLTGPFTLYGNDHSVMTAFPTRSLQVTNTGITTFTGVISDGGSNLNFNIFGVGGVTRFQNTEAYGGITTNGGVTLLVNGQVGPGAVFVLTNSTSLGGTNASATLGGVGTITGPVTIQSGGTLTAGDDASGTPTIGTLTVNNTVTFQAGSKALVKVEYPGRSSDRIQGITTANYGGTLVVNTTGGGAGLGDAYQVFSAAAHSGNFTSVVGSPGTGLAWSFDPTAGTITVVSSIVPFTVSPHISSISIQSGTNIIVNGTNAQANAIYYMLTSTNLQLPLPQWTPVGTNITTAANNFSFTNSSANPFEPKRFYILSNTNF